MLLTILLCKRTLLRLSDYLDRELSPQEMKDVRRHLAICHACREKFAFEGRLIEVERERFQNEAALETADFDSAQVRQMLEDAKNRIDESEPNH